MKAAGSYNKDPKYDKPSTYKLGEILDTCLEAMLAFRSFVRMKAKLSWLQRDSRLCIEASAKKKEEMLR
jgi:hypothetical protein